MEYIVYKRFKTKAICGEVNIPAMSAVKMLDGIMFYNEKPLCIATSENAHTYFMRNDDGNGMERGEVIESIKDKLRTNAEKWDIVQADTLCQKYKRKEHADHWLWNHDFYNADIEDLRYINSLVADGNTIVGRCAL